MTDRATPTPEEFERELAWIRKNLHALARQYRWTYNTAYGRTAGEVARRSEGDVARPTEEVATAGSKDRLRRHARRAHGRVVQAASRISEAAELLDTANRERDTYTPTRRPYPRIVTRSELQESREAKARREARGEGFGEG